MEDRTNRNFRPTPEWMLQKYDELNKLYFDGKLGGCNFSLFTTGRGSEGRILGKFKITGNIEAYRGQRMYTYLTFDLINKDNFVELCKPLIQLNGNYAGTEFGFTCTLIHEMCHYYNYMDGYCPSKSHGLEFKEAAAMVNNLSKGIYSIQRIASAEQMNELDLDPKFKEKRERRIQNKHNNTKVVLVFLLDGEIFMVRTIYDSLVKKIVDYEARMKRALRIGMITDPEFNEFIFKKGYRSNSKKYRAWNIEKENWLPEIEKYHQESLWVNPEYDYEDDKEETEVQTPEPKPQPTQIFTLKTRSGDWTIPFNGDYEELAEKVRERFPKLPETLIQKLIGNSGNFKPYTMKESKQYIKEIVESVIKELKMKKKDSIRITPEMDLGEYSPLELMDNMK